MISIRRLAASAVAAVCLCLSSAASASVVHAPAGTLEGRSEGATNVFKGIPYAVPPVGPLRWKAPVEMPRWTGVRQAMELARPVCSRAAKPSACTVPILPR